MFGDHHFDAVLRCQVHHLVVAVPIELSWSNLNDPPHKPVTEGVNADTRGCLVIPSPIFFRRVGFTEVDGSVRKDRGLYLPTFQGLAECGNSWQSACLNHCSSTGRKC